MKKFIAVVMLLSAVAVATPASPARALPPGISTENDNLTINSTMVRGVVWPKCTSATQVYCWEMPSVITPNGVETTMNVGALADPAQPMAGYVAGTPWVYCHNNEIESRANCVLDGSDWLDIQLVGDFAQADTANTYHWKVRTGKFSPDVLMMGDTQKNVVAGNATEGWTIEIWAKPALFAYRDNCLPPTCGQNDIATRVSYKLQGYTTMLSIGSNQMRPSVATAAQRDALRGAYISTNAMTQSWNFNTDTFSVTATSPHFLTDGTTVTPGFVKAWVPASYILLDRGYTNINQIDPSFIELKVSQVLSTAKVSIVNNGLLIDTGIEHYSSPNPTIKVKSATETMASQNLAVLSSNNSASTGSSATSGSYVKTVISGVKATVTVTLATAGTFSVYRKVGSKLTLVKKVSGKKGTNKVTTSYLKGYSFVVKDSKGKTLAVKTAAVRFARFY